MFGKRKFLALTMILVLMLSLVLTSCGVKNDDVFRVGMEVGYPPMEYTGEDGKEVIGFDVDVAKEIGTRLGKKDFKIISTAWDGIFAALETDKFDCIISSCSINEQRQKEHSLTNAYVANKLVIVTSSSNTDIVSPETLTGKKVGVQSATTSSDFAKELNKDSKKFDFTPYDQVTQPFADLKAGRIDAIIVDIVVAGYYTSKDKESFKTSWESPNSEPMAICCQKKGTDLRDKINKILDEMQADGTMKTISEKWFGTDITKNL